MNQLNEQLRAVRTSKEHIKRCMMETFDIGELLKLENQLTQLDDEEQRLLREIGL